MSLQKRSSGILFLIGFMIALNALTMEAFAGIFSVGSIVRTSCANCGPGVDAVCVSVEDATCTTSALMYVKCPKCQTVKSLWNGGSLSGLGHDWIETNRISAACDSPGRIDYSCSRCAETKTDTLPALEHDWRETGRIEPTTEAAGAVTYQCSICAKSKSEVLPKLEPEECTHDWLETDRQLPTETTPGQIIYICSKCGEVKTEVIPVKPVYDEVFINWLGSVMRLFNMTLNSIMGFPALRLFVGALVFLMMFSLLAKLLRQGRRGQL